jgi:DNA polymerase-3 subunit epsilon
MQCLILVIRNRLPARKSNHFVDEMPTFTAIDFETAQPARCSICQIGLVCVEQGQVVDQLSILVQPPENTYSYWNTNVHGLTEVDTLDAPFFNAVWPQIRGYIEGRTVVAHNGAFDFSCLRKTLEFYGEAEPAYEPQCTYKIYKKKLNLLCEQYAIPLNHHDALSDARACAELYLRHVRTAQV